MQRKVFRVEQMLAADRAAVPRPSSNERHALRALAERREEAIDATVQGLERELALVRDTMTRNKEELTALIGDGETRRMARAAGELGAAVEGMERATDGILKSVEIVDECARALTATLRDDFERGLAQDIQDHVVKIYEACNFQDLAGQRIGNVIRTLNSVEEQVAAMLERCNAVRGKTHALAKSTQTLPATARGLVNGPRLDGDSGHAGQRDIDKLFADSCGLP